MENGDETTMEREDTRSPAAVFLDKTKAFCNRSLEDRLRYVLTAITENIQQRYGFLSRNIFQAVFKDPEKLEYQGQEWFDNYWKGWSDMAGLTVEEFADLLATHKMADQADICYLKGDCSKSPECQECQGKYLAVREAVILRLHDAVEMEVLPFKGDATALLHATRGATHPGWSYYDQSDHKAKTFNDTKIYPRETIKWFADTPARAELLPDSLRNWWTSQLKPPQNTHERTIGEETGRKESASPVLGAIRTKLRLKDKKVEEDWNSKKLSLLEQIDPMHPATMQDQIESFQSVTVGLIKRKADSMKEKALEILSPMEIDKNFHDKIRRFILTFFDDAAYVERLIPFVKSIELKFKSQARVFDSPATLRAIDLNEAAFKCAVMNNLRQARGEIAADFTILAARVCVRQTTLRVRNNDPNLFPELNFSTMKSYTDGWAEKWPVIQKITLSRYFPGHPRIIRGVPIKYALTFEICGDEPALRAFENVTNCRRTIRDEGGDGVLFEDFMPPAFENVYRQGVKEDYQKEWRLDPKRESQEPFNYEGNVSWLLFDPDSELVLSSAETTTTETKADFTVTEAAQRRCARLSNFDMSLRAHARKLLRKRPYLTIPGIAKVALRNQEDFLYGLKPGKRELPKQETVEKHLRKLLKGQS